MTAEEWTDRFDKGVVKNALKGGLVSKLVWDIISDLEAVEKGYAAALLMAEERLAKNEEAAQKIAEWASLAQEDFMRAVRAEIDIEKLKMDAEHLQYERDEARAALVACGDRRDSWERSAEARGRRAEIAEAAMEKSQDAAQFYADKFNEANAEVSALRKSAVEIQRLLHSQRWMEATEAIDAALAEARKTTSSK